MNTRMILLLQAAAAASAMATALIAQYGFLLHPCELCLMQRVPYVAVIIIALLAAKLAKSSRALLYFVLLCTVLFAVDAGIAFYHAGVELDIFKGPDACSNTSTGGEQTLEEMRAAILNAPLVSCKQAMAYFLGISLAAWNGLAACMFTIASLMACVYGRKISR